LSRSGPPSDRPDFIDKGAMGNSPDKIPENVAFAAQELLEAPEADRPATLENIAKALTRRLLKDEPGLGAREIRGASRRS
jgi:hypothetical protein